MGYGHDGDGDFDYEAGRAEAEMEMLHLAEFEEMDARWAEFFPEGDARRCPSHPNVKTSSPDGMFDAPCGRCEYEMSLDADAEYASTLIDAQEAAETEHNPIVAYRMGHPIYLSDIPDDCPF
jgi:hypothetical protein